MKWISVKKRLPKEHKIVLVVNNGAIQLSQRGFDGDEWLWCEPDDDATISEEFYDLDSGESCVTHWMSIPKAPK